MTKLRVLTVTNYWPTKTDPAFGAAIEAQTESLRACGVDCDVIFVNGRASRWNYLKGVFEVRRRLAAGRYDFVLAHFGLSGWVARFQWKAPVLVRFTGDDVLGQFDWRGRKTMMGRCYQLSSIILARLVQGTIVMSEEMKRKIRYKNAVVIPPGVNLKLFRPLDQAECREKLGLDAGKKYVVFPYDRLEARKRFDLIQEAVRLARNEVPELEILEVFRIDQERLSVYYNAADLFVLASMWEGSPNSVKEAMAVNLPVISADVGDVRNLIGSTEGCYIVPREPEVIARRIVEVCRRKTRTNGREWIEQWSVEGAMRKTLEVYAKAAGGKNANYGSGR